MEGHTESKGSDEYNMNLAGRKVAYIPFSLANPRIAVIDRQDTSAPCIAACPGGVKPYGYITLVRNGQYEEAMKLHMEDAPLPGWIRLGGPPVPGDRETVGVG